MTTLTEFEAAYMVFMDTRTPPTRTHARVRVMYKYQHPNDMLVFWQAARTVTLPVDDNEPGYAETLVAALKAQGFIVK